jgi:glycerol-3-phosphate O-acyltransferase
MPSASQEPHAVPLKPPTATWFKALQFNAARKLLFSWIKPTVLGCDTLNLGISDDDSVCYVLPFRSLADLLVIDKACEDAGLPRPCAPLTQHVNDNQFPALEDHAFFFIGHPEGTFGRKVLRQRSDHMTSLLLQHAARKSPVKIIPVSLFWGHQPDRENSWLKLLFSENWTATTRLKKLLAILFHSKHILVQYSPAIDLNRLILDEDDKEKQTRKLMRILRVHFNQQKQAILGPDLSHRRTLIKSIMNCDAVREAIAKEVRAKQSIPTDVEKKALAYANEIASHQSYRVIRLFHTLLTWFWTKLYDGIEINNISTVKDIAKDCEIVYVPCHRSHIDYLLLSYVLYHNGLTPPHIAAGKNLNLPIVGPLLRRAGAFYMRRSFQGDGLYKAIFDEYMHLMFTRGYSVEYFIEGGRSRTGRSLNPRTGMLSMTIRSFQRDSSKPICFMPVYFGYEKIIEDTTYLAELSGAAKKDESILDIFRVLRSLKNHFGKVTVNFGEPLRLAQFLDQHLPDWQQPDITQPADFTAACGQLATHLARDINAAAAINPVNLVATVLLSTPRQTIEEDQLLSHINTLARVARDMAFSQHLSITSLTATEIVKQAEQVTGILRSHESFGDMLRAPAPLPVLLTYYRNNTIHVFALPSLVARLLHHEGDLTELISTCQALYPFLQAEFFLPWEEVDLPQVIERIVNVLSDLQLVQVEAGCTICPADTTETYVNLVELGQIIVPTLERYFIVSELLDHHTQTTLRELESNAAQIGHRLSAFYGINAPEFFDKSLFSAFITTLKARGLVNTGPDDLTVNRAFTGLKQSLQDAMDPDLMINVRQSVHRQLGKRNP